MSKEQDLLDLYVYLNVMTDRGFVNSVDDVRKLAEKWLDDEKLSYDLFLEETEDSYILDLLPIRRLLLYER